MIMWQPTELSIVDEYANYIHDEGAGIPWTYDLNLSQYLPLSPEERVDVSSATAELWRRLNPWEIRSEKQARLVKVGDDVVGTVVGNMTTLTLLSLAFPPLQAGNFYQIKLTVNASGVAWVRTREVRCPA